jgi:predicted ATPase/DNA-binding SARP family transcriptional activator
LEVLHIHLLGEFSLVYGDRSVATVNTARLQSLFAYLVMHRDAPPPRYHLAFQFWPDSSESQARTNLRHLLHRLRGALPHADDFLRVDGVMLQWRSDAPFTLDVAEFESAITRGALQEAVDLHRGDLLPGCYDDWILRERDRLHQMLMEAIGQLIQQSETGRDYRAAIAHTQRLLRLEPLHEETYRRLMRLHALNGDRIGVVRAYGTCLTVLQRELDVEPAVGTRELYRRCLKMAAAARQVAEGMPPARADLGPNNLPPQLTRFIGRMREKSEVKKLVAARRLVTLTGAGGVGKTRLALAVAADLLGAFADGVWHVDLAPLTNAAAVVPAVASAMAVPGEAGRPLLEHLEDDLRGKRLLLLLDNCGHLVQAVRPVVEALLGAAPKLHILATSRVVLRAAGEVTWCVPPLTVPDMSRWAAAARPEGETDSPHPDLRLALQRYESVQLFLDRALAALPTFALTNQNAWAVGQICQQLDGVPLALELVAARVKLLTGQQIADHLKDALWLLTHGSSKSLPHQQTMRATMDWSHALLTSEEQVLFRRLSVFAGGAAFEAVEAICCGQGIERDQVLNLLSGVVDKSLVSADPLDEAMRYRLHEVARQYARARLAEAKEESWVRNRHLDFFCRLAEALQPNLLGTMPPGAVSRMKREHHNLRAALEWSIREEGDAQSGLRLAAALPGFWEVQGLFAEERGYLVTLLDRAGAAAPPAVRARALRGAGKVARYQCDFGAARSFFEQSLALDRELDDKPRMADTLARLGFLFSVQQEYAAAEPFFQESLAISRTLGDRSAVARVLTELGYTAFRQGESAQARSFLEEGLALCQDSDDYYLAARCRHFSGHMARFEGDYARSRSLYTQSLTTFNEIGNAWSIFFSLEAFAYLATAEGQFEHAARLFGAAEHLGETIGTSIPPSERVEHDRDVAAVRAALGEPACAAQWAKGRALMQDEAVAYALKQP